MIWLEYFPQKLNIGHDIFESNSDRELLMWGHVKDVKVYILDVTISSKMITSSDSFLYYGMLIDVRF